MRTIDEGIKGILIPTRGNIKKNLERAINYSKEKHLEVQFIASENSSQTIYQDLAFNFSREITGRYILISNDTQIKEFKFWEDYLKKKNNLSENLKLEYISTMEESTRQKIYDSLSMFISKRWVNGKKSILFINLIKNIFKE